MTVHPASLAKPVPLDPDSAKGREVAARLTTVLTDVRAEIAADTARAVAAAIAHPTGSP